VNRRRVLRLAEVLVASQLRSGRARSDPKSFFARPLALGVLDAILFVTVFVVGVAILRSAQMSAPGLVAPLAAQALAFLPLVALGIVLIAGIMFELTTTARFAASDAANWMPIEPIEYVAASSVAATVSYSITIAFLLGIGLAFAVVTGTMPAFALAAVLTLLALFEGGVLIEILRASTQRISTAVTRRTGRATLVLRIVLFLAVILVFELAFNPVFLFQFLRDFANAGPVAFAIPVLWASRAVSAFEGGQILLALALAAADVALAALLLVVAAAVRTRFWTASVTEVAFAAYRYAGDHPFLARLGLSTPEATLVAKDMRGLVRRREMLPILVVPMVIFIVSLLSTYTVGGGGGAPIAVGIFATWVPGFFALLLASTSFGQERRAIVTLYSLPLEPRTIFRAKAATILLPASGFGLGAWAVAVAITRPPLLASAILLALVGVVILVGAFLGIASAARYSDYQERPRPQYIRPAPMLATMFLGLIMIFGIALPTLFWIDTPGLPLGLALTPVVASFAVGAVIVSLTYLFARGGTFALLRALPI
jgi:hypothetical protein